MSRASLSAGEAPLLALTRVYASEAAIMVLDEATSHLDPASEPTAEAAFAARGGIVVIVAHRLSSARRAEGSVPEGAGTGLGSHSELLARWPRYAAPMSAWRGSPPTYSPSTPQPSSARA